MNVRGFSLVEVLASLCVLSLLAAAVMPLVAECRRLEERGSNRALIALSIAADQLCADASANGIDALAVGERRLVTSPDSLEVAVERLLLVASDAHGDDWLKFSVGESEVIRFVPRSEPPR